MTDRLLTTAIYEIALPAPVRNACAPGTRGYLMGAARILVSNEAEGWHLSISCADRDPTWDEIATARYKLCGHVREMGMFLPPLSEYVNIHPFTFHLYENPPRDKPAIIVP